MPSLGVYIIGYHLFRLCFAEAQIGAELCGEALGFLRFLADFFGFGLGFWHGAYLHYTVKNATPLDKIVTIWS